MNILIVDDISEYADSLEFYFSRPGWTLTKAQSLDEAKAAVSRIVPDLAIIDVCLSGRDLDNTDGLKFLCWLKESHPSTRAVVISAYNSFDYAVDAIQAGAERFLKKPLNIRELQDVLKSL
jgi:DNA-binding NtrC family response regulator